MPTYKGNRGNLLQHWVLSELIAGLRQGLGPGSDLCFVDAHAMSPYATRSPNPGQNGEDFSNVERRLPGQESTYEVAWTALRRGPCEYPSSAAFVSHLWQDSLHLFLCERDPTTADEIDRWSETLDDRVRYELHRGDWRETVADGLPSTSDALLMSFDPYMFDRHGRPGHGNLGNMIPADLEIVCTATAAILGPIALQLSTYSANNANRQEDVASVVVARLEEAGFRLVDLIPADGNMMSLVFGRSIALELRLAARWKDWMVASLGGASRAGPGRSWRR